SRRRRRRSPRWSPSPRSRAPPPRPPAPQEAARDGPPGALSPSRRRPRPRSFLGRARRRVGIPLPGLRPVVGRRRRRRFGRVGRGSPRELAGQLGIPLRLALEFLRPFAAGVVWAGHRTLLSSVPVSHIHA